MRIEWTGDDASIPSLGLKLTAGQVVDVDAAVGESLIEQGKARRKTTKKQSKSPTKKGST